MYYVAMLGKNLVISCLNTYRVSIHLNECCTFQRIKPLLMCGSRYFYRGVRKLFEFSKGGGGLKHILGNFINKCKFKEICPPPPLPCLQIFA